MLQQTLTLAPSPHSARAARGFVGHVLSEARADRFAELTALLTSELVTNGIVHAHTDLKVQVEATPRWVRVEVGDRDPRLPARREYGDQAMTGRGLEMVELLADDFGVEPLDEEGKRVWFRLGDTPDASESVEPVAENGGMRTTRVELIGLPVALYCVWQQRADAVLREAALLSFSDGDTDAEADGDHPLASRALRALADAAGDVFALRDDGVASVDVTVEIATDAVPWFPILRDILGRSTAMSRAGQLLIPPSLPELAALRDWIFDEVARQAAGLHPTPWPGVGVGESGRRES